MEIILTLIYLFLFIILIRKMPFFKLEGFHRNALPAVFVLKVAAGVVLYLVYSYYYTDRSTADIFKYFDDSKVMYDALFTKPADFFQMLTGINNDAPRFEAYYSQMNYWYRVYESNIYNDSHTIIRLNAVIRLFSFGYYNVHTVFMCFISMAGLTGIYRFFSDAMKDRKWGLFAAVFLIPSVLFWGSGVLKEGLLLFGLGMLLWHIRLILQKRSIWFSACMITGSILLLMYTKFYVLILMLPLLIAYVWCEVTSGKYSLLKYLLVLSVFLAAGLNFHRIFPDYNFLGIMVQKQHDFIALSQSVQSGSAVNMAPLEPNFLSLLSHMPQALYNGFFLPWFFEGGSPLIIAAGLENLLILLCILICIVFCSRPENLPLFWMSLFFALGILCLTGLTTPVVGAIVRYKVPALPFLLISFIMILHPSKTGKVRALLNSTRKRP